MIEDIGGHFMETVFDRGLINEYVQIFTQLKLNFTYTELELGRTSATACCQLFPFVVTFFSRLSLSFLWGGRMGGP